MTGNGDGGPASAATSTIIGNGCTRPAPYENLFITLGNQTLAASDTQVASAWNQRFNPSNANTIFYNGPQTGESYVEDIADNDVRTEGQSYGMMIAVQLDHQTEFDALWAFAKHYMYQSSNCQYAWHVSTTGAVLATGGAPDGDEWFAEALVFAHYRWGDTSGKYNYGTEAQSVLNLVRTQDFDQSNISSSTTQVRAIRPKAPTAPTSCRPTIRRGRASTPRMPISGMPRSRPRAVSSIPSRHRTA